MKKLILTFAASLACVAAFGQGKLAFAADSLHLVYYDPAIAGVGGTAVNATNTPGGFTLVADLYAGASAGALQLVSSTTFGTSPSFNGRWGSENVQFNNPALPAATAAFFQIVIHDNAHTSASNAVWFGSSPVFTAAPASSGFNPIYQPTSPINSTWAAGTFALDSVAAGYKGAIMVTTVPEPASFALGGLAVAALTIFRRRK
jgi:hypothetical protein